MLRTDVINELIRMHGYKSYLEIGVHRPWCNFDLVRIDGQRVSVDPDKDSGAVYTVTSDEYFERLNRGMKFDIVFIDGLHQWEQVLRDVDNALAVLEPGGTIVVHDCDPETFERQLVPMTVSQWNGDVWRAWVELRSRPDLEMACLNLDYGVGIIRRGAQEPLVVPRADMTFDRLRSNRREWLNLVPGWMLYGPVAMKHRRVVVAPWSNKLPNVENPKNYPWWPELVNALRGHGIRTVQVGRTGERLVGCDEAVFDADQVGLAALADSCDAFFSVDTFFQHFAHNRGLRGVAIFGQSDPEIFGHWENANVLGGREHLRAMQYASWPEAEYNAEAFPSVETVMSEALPFLGLGDFSSWIPASSAPTAAPPAPPANI